MFPQQHTMSQFVIRTFGRIQVTGKDFEPFEDDEARNILATPDDKHLIRIHSQANKILINNPANIDWAFTVTGYANNDLHVYAVLSYKAGTNVILVNNNWSIHVEGPTNRMVQDHDELNVNLFMNIRLHSSNFENISMGRIDVSFNNSETTSLFFTPTELLFLSLNGDATENAVNEHTNRLVRIGIQD